jgi:putative photosynthetic complex assembly protein
MALWGLVLVSLVLVGLARVTGWSYLHLDVSEVKAQILVRFEDMPDGSVHAYDPETGQLIHVVPPGGDGFVRGLLRGLSRDRKLRKLDPAAPFRLVAHTNEQLSIEDQSTGRVVHLNAFGPSNKAPFAKMLSASRTAQQQ